MLKRATALKRLAESEFDVLVVGGGITGAGVALDAASRGYSVALVEGSDFAAGTSSRSSKLIHGGLRYLQSLDLGLVREALLERQLMVTLAPHLVRPLPLVVAAFGGTRPDRLMGLGLNLYDVMSVDRHWLRARRARASSARQGRPELESWSPERHRMISGAEVLELLPALEGRGPTGGYLFYDCQADDVRLVLTILGEAERFGAVCANRLWATGLIERSGRVAGARLRDGVGGPELEIRAANVVNATGVWADRLGRQAPGESGAAVPRIRPSRGTHITVRQKDLPLHSGAIVPAPDGRSIFALPWMGRTLIGTTDGDFEGDLDHVAPGAVEVDYLLAAVNEFFGCEIAADQLTGAFAGLRPLIVTGEDGLRKSMDISRRAELYETAGGMITITGGKLTTWRRMAKLTVDRMVAREDRKAPCRTHRIPLGEPISGYELDRVEGVAEVAYEALAARYGSLSKQVLGIARGRSELRGPILDGHPDLLAEVVMAARHEQALSLADVLSRRTRLGEIAAPELSRESARVRRVAELLAGELDWSERQTEGELECFRDEAVCGSLCPAA